ncbi:helix-turn-helix domain-containing protein [Nocardia sp. NEAU-G5]|uniref:Helix-turn-helix domain-containing protein n=1 Tax=Nocardia albiluteola TaxID=2842303 RepID=A0ABS6B569_9NOCA|nr:helix-turn-helix domain-containing protein [Nocardia albiluteola]MBU3065394.1 helix-turn-helix domain-containing protein [Nocardia albiluteola]
MDSTPPDAPPRSFDSNRHRWEARFPGGRALPTFTPDTVGDFRIKAHAVRMRELTMVDIHGASTIRTTRPVEGVEGQVQLHLVSRGAWTLDGRSDRGEHTIQAGQFLLQHLRKPTHFETAPHTTAKIITVMPPTPLEPMLRDRMITGPADSTEIRLLVAYADMVRTTMPDLGPAGIHAANGALLELIKGVALGGFDDAEPQLAPALAQAARDLADRWLADPGLSTTTLARELNVSIRTLQRAFASAGEPVTAYIRRRRLEEARRALTASPDRPSISEIAAHWQFSDSSHFIRVFKSAYGRTPAEYTRSIWARRECERTTRP